MNTCKHEGCPRPVKSKGYCPSHYQQFRMRGYTTDILNTQNTKPDEEFIQREKERLADIAKRKAEREARKAVYGNCVAPGCVKKARVAKTQECMRHYQQRRAGTPYRELRVWSKKQDKDAPRRQCNGCKRVKDTRAEFYARSNGTPMNECKVCSGLRSRYNRLIVEGRTGEAAVEKAAWDAYVASGATEQG